MHGQQNKKKSRLLSTESMYRNAFRSPNPRHTRWQPIRWTFVILNCTTPTVGFYWTYLLATGKMIQVDLLANGLTCIMNLCWRKYAAARYCQRENTDVTIRDATKRDGTRLNVPFIVVGLINKPSIFFTFDSWLSVRLVWMSWSLRFVTHSWLNAWEWLNQSPAQGCTISVRQVARATKFCTVALNILGSAVLNLGSPFWRLK